MEDMKQNREKENYKINKKSKFVSHKDDRLMMNINRINDFCSLQVKFINEESLKGEIYARNFADLICTMKKECVRKYTCYALNTFNGLIF